MSSGKLAAQVAHAAVEAYRISKSEILAEWYKGGHHTKLVMLAEDTEQLLSIQRYLDARDFKAHLVIDEGRTEIRPFTPTALGVEVVDKDDENVAACFGEFKTYKALPTPQRNGRWRYWRWHSGR